MKLLKKLPLYCLLIAFAVSCEDGYIDDITPVSPGADAEDPTVEIVYPEEGTEILDPNEVASINIQFEATDDIEIASIRLTMDGSELTTMTDFKDYRKVIGAYLYDNVTEGDHTLTVTVTDIADKSTSATVDFTKLPLYEPKYDGEIFYMPFDGAPGSTIELVSLTYPTEVGSPGFAGSGKIGGNSYAGASGSYLTYPADDMMGNEFSAAFWMKINATPDRAGILVIGPPDEGNADFPETQNLRTSGFRFFRENGADGNQRFKLNVGTGSGESWFDGGANADVDPNTGEWVHFAFTISQTSAAVYINGEVASQGDFPGIDWANCDIISIMSGAPRFTGWGHLSDQSFMDELRIFNKALSQAEVQAIIADES